MSNLLAVVKETDDLLKKLFRFTNAQQVKLRSGPVLILQCGSTCRVAASIVESSNDVVKVGKIQDAEEYIKNNDVRLFVLDMHKADYGMALLESLKENHPELPIIVSITEDGFKEEIEKNFPDVEVVHSEGCQCQCQQVLSSLNETSKNWTLFLKDKKA